MINLEEFLYFKVKPIIESWDEEEIYAISFFVHTNEATDNIPYFAISYNTEEDCGYCSLVSEERWNYAFWRQDENEIIGDEKSTNLLLQWYEDNNVKSIGKVNKSPIYDEEGNYIGKGPNGYYELLQIVADVAKRLHNEKVILNTFQRVIPIIIHDLEYTWYELEATRRGNPSGLVDTFLRAIS
jgi:hypothetical protein